MTANLSQKEKTLLQDQLTHEKVCIQKYQDYANQASSQQLKQLFQNYAQQEQQHYNTISQILNGQVPSMNQSQQSGMQSQTQTGQQNQQSPAQTQNYAGAMSAGMQNATAAGGTSATATATTTSSASKQDAAICNDMLMTEKYVSGAYDSAIFEFTDSNVRQALNHIQKEEQQHGEGIFNFMQSAGLYSVK